MAAANPCVFLVYSSHQYPQAKCGQCDWVESEIIYISLDRFKAFDAATASHEKQVKEKKYSGVITQVVVSGLDCHPNLWDDDDNCIVYELCTIKKPTPSPLARDCKVQDCKMQPLETIDE